MLAHKLAREACEIVEQLSLYAQHAEQLGCIPHPLRGTSSAARVDDEGAEINIEGQGLVAIGNAQGWHVGREVLLRGTRCRPDGSGEPDEIEWVQVSGGIEAKDVPVAILGMFIADALARFDQEVEGRRR